MGGNACKRYGVTRITHYQYEKVRNLIYFATASRVSPIQSFIKESHGDIDFVAFRSDKEVIESIFNSSESLVHLGQVENGDMMTSYALEVDVDKETRVTVQVDILWVHTSARYRLSKFLHSWNGFIIYFLNRRIRNINPNLTLNDKGLIYNLELRRTRNSNPSKVEEITVTDNLETILSLCGLYNKSEFKSEEEAFKWLNSSPLHTKDEFKYNPDTSFEIVHAYFEWNKNQPEVKVDEEFKKRVLRKFNRVLSILPTGIRKITKLFKTETYYKSLVKFNRVRKIEDYLLRTYFLDTTPLSNEEIGYVIRESIPKILTVTKGKGHSRKLHDHIIKNELVIMLISKLRQKEGIIE